MKKQKNGENYPVWIHRASAAEGQGGARKETEKEEEGEEDNQIQILTTI